MSHSPFLLLVTRTSEPNGYIDRRFRFVYRCGFSQKIVGILNSEEIEYTTFDILGDEGVRQSTFFLSFFGLDSRASPTDETIPLEILCAELKELNEWPTFPQLIIKGEFCGGLDVIKEMQESGELQEMIKG